MVKGGKIESFEDLDVYQKLCQLHLEVSQASLRFLKFELHELGPQLRRSSNASPANIAEGWNNRHIKEKVYKRIYWKIFKKDWGD